MDNSEIADTLEELADLLAHSGANPFRVRAYRQGADTVRHLGRPAAAILAEEGRPGLERLENIGSGLAAAIEELVQTGSLHLLDELRAEVSPEELFASLPGIGPALAQRIHESLGITTLDELAQAAEDGRLAQIEGVGRATVEQVRAALQARPGRRAGGAKQPPVAELLDVDREYREQAAAGRLFKLAPRRHNPRGEAWLPVLHTRRGDRRYTALFSNTRLAHELGKTGEWVVLYYALPGEQEGQATVVNETQGDLADLRVVRGREQETKEHYESGTARRAV
jgi:DNA polymerase (family 10)